MLSNETNSIHFNNKKNMVRLLVIMEGKVGEIVAFDLID
jgi:hypothetical protein